MVQIDVGYDRRVAANALKRQVHLVASIGRQHAGGAEIEPGRRGVPELDLAEQIGSLDGREHEVHPKRNRNALRLQEAPPGVGEILDNAGVKAKVANLVGDNDIDLFRQINVSGMSLDEDYPVPISIGPRHVAGDREHPAHFDRVNASSPCSAGEQTHDAGSGSQVENYLAGSDHRQNRSLEGRQPHTVDKILPVFVNNKRQRRRIRWANCLRPDALQATSRAP